MSEDKRSLWQRLKDGAADGADSVTSGVKSIKDSGIRLVSHTTDGFNAAVNAIDSSVRSSITATYGMVSSGVDAVDNSVQGARNLAADIVSSGGKVIGLGGGLAGEVTLIVATAPMFCIPYLFIGGSAAELGKQFADSTSDFSKHIRGARPRFIGIHKDEGFFADELKAILYLPSEVDANHDGFVFVSESQLDAGKKIDDLVKRSLYETALFAIQDAKLKSGMSLDAPKFLGREGAGAFTGAPRIKR